MNTFGTGMSRLQAMSNDKACQQMEMFVSEYVHVPSLNLA